MPFQFRKLEIPDVILIEPEVFADNRGFFLETYQLEAFDANGIELEFVQDNQSRSTRGVLRGLHYQLPPRAQGKLIRAVRGSVFDVAVDIRSGSPTFGRWVGEELSAENSRMLYVPPGFAHGFCVLSDEVDILYKTSDAYAPELERGIIWNDPEIGIRWPIGDVILSEKDSRLPAFAAADLP